MSKNKSKKSKASSAKNGAMNTNLHVAEGRKLEAALNRALQQFDFDGASKIADAYIAKYQEYLSYKHLVTVAEIYLQAGNYQKCHDLLMSALKMDSTSEAAPEILFWLHHRKGDSQKAREVLDQLLNLGPDHKRFMYLQWKALRANLESDHAEVIEIFEEIGMPSPDEDRFHELMFAYLMALCHVESFEQAQTILDQIPREVQETTPNLPLIRAQILKSAGDIDGAINQYTFVAQKFNDLPDAVWNRALCLLEKGDLCAGWEDYLHRFERESFPSPRVLVDAPEWRGENLENKKIIIWPEQGLGDQILFLTLAISLLSTKGVTVLMAVHPKLKNLVSAWYPEALVEPLIEIDVRNTKAFQGADYQIPMGSLPRYLLNSEEQLEKRPIRLLNSNLILKDDVYDQMGWSQDDLLVGLCWRSSVVDVSRAPNYLSVEMVQTLVNNLPANVRIINLQYKLNQDEREVLGRVGAYIPDVEFFDDIVAHAQYVGICDYVVTPGTLTKQLAGVFNRPTLTWGGSNWSYLGRDNYPWYRSIATLKIQRDHSKSSLVYQIGRWLNIAIENHQLMDG